MRGNPLALREPGAEDGGGSGGDEREEPELDVSTPLSYFDEYREQPAGGQERDEEAAGEASPRPHVGPAGDHIARDEGEEAASSPRVRINMTVTVAEPLGDEQLVVGGGQGSAAAAAAADATTDGGGGPGQDSTTADNPIDLPASPHLARKQFVISFRDVQSPEKRESFKPAPMPEPAKKKVLSSPQRRMEEEGLGDDWAAHPWKEPSVEVAKSRRRRALVSQGKLSLLRTGPDDLLFLGRGLALYFYFVRAIALFCLVATLLHVPHIVISYSGGMLDAYQISPTTAGYFMAANHMVAYPGSEEGMRWCEGETVDTVFQPRVSCAEPVIRLFGRRSRVYIKADHATYLVTVCDAVTCLAFVATWLLLVRKHESVKETKPMSSVVTAQDYAVQVEGLPPDATEEEICVHFNRLYAINGGDEDWTHPGDCCGLANAKTYQRTPQSIVDIVGNVIGPSLQPVDQPLPGHDHPMYKRSWIAEAVVVHPMGPLLRRFKKLEKLSQEVLWQRALAKKYNANTTYKDGKGANKKRFDKAQEALRATQDRIEEEQLRLKSEAKTLVKMEKLCAGAYVIFEHRRSRDRALRDYRLYSNHLPPFVQPPPPLLFRGRHRLIVTEAPPPSDIRYENLEAGAASRAVRQVFTNLVTILLLISALFLVVTLRRVSEGYAEGADVNTQVCGVLGDQVYAGSAGLDTTTSSATPWYHLPPGDGLSPCDPGSHYLSFFPPSSAEGTPPPPPMDGCAAPCFDPQDKEALQVYQTCPSGLELRRGDLVKCFCIARFGQMATATSAATATATAAGAGAPAETAEWATASYEQMENEGVLDLCMSPAWAFFVSQVVSAVASIVTNVVNELIRFALPQLVEWELHGCQSASITTFFIKTLLFLFLNTVGLLLLIHLRVENRALNDLGFFKGTSADFDLSWYLMVGLSISNTMLLNAFTTQLPFLASELVVGPLLRVVKSWRDNKVSQLHLNKAFAPSAFKVPTRLAVMVNTLIITLLFNSAIPLLVPFALVAFTLAYMVDKLLLLRYCAKPPAYDGRLVRFSIDMMPYLLAGHLLISICVFGHPAFFASRGWLRLTEIKVDENAPTTAYDTLSDSGTDPAIVERVFLYSTLPLCILFVLLVVGKVLNLLWRDLRLAFRWLRRVLAPYTHRCCTDPVDAELLEEEEDGAGRNGEADEDGWWWSWRRQGRRSRRGRGRGSSVAGRHGNSGRLNNFPPYTRKFEVGYPTRAAVPAFPPDCGWMVEHASPIAGSWRASCVKLVKRWTEDELATSAAPKEAAAAAAAAPVDADADDGGEARILYKRTWEVIREGGLHSYRIEDNPAYADLMLVRATLHLTAKSLLGIEASQIDWSKIMTARHYKDEEDHDDDDDEDDERQNERPGGLFAKRAKHGGGRPRHSKKEEEQQQGRVADTA